MEYKDFRFQVKGLTDLGQFSGYAAYKNNVDAYNDIILDGSFKRTIRNKKQFPILFMHDPTRPVGISTLMKEDKNGLYTEGQLDLTTEMGKMVYSGLKMGYIDAMSIGFNVVQDEIDKGGRRLLKEIKLLEYSLITKGFQANELARVSGFKSNNDLERRLKVLEEKEDEEVNIDPILERLESVEEEIKRLADSLLSTQPFLMSQDSPSGTLEQKSVIGSTNLPLTDKEKEWDGSGAKKRIFEWAGGSEFDPEKAKKAFFFMNGDPKARGSYKLPFADVIDGKLMVVPRALSAVEGALNGARGGIEGVSPEDKDSILNKVNAYKKRMENTEKNLRFWLLREELKMMLEEEDDE